LYCIAQSPYSPLNHEPCPPQCIRCQILQADKRFARGIVVKIEVLMELCDRLAAGLAVKNRRFLDTSLPGALVPSQSPELEVAE